MTTHPHGHSPFGGIDLAITLGTRMNQQSATRLRDDEIRRALKHGSSIDAIAEHTGLDPENVTRIGNSDLPPILGD